MCGIFGVIDSNNHVQSPTFIDTVNDLFVLSESRGKEAAGIVIGKDNALHVYKEPISGHDFIATTTYTSLLRDAASQQHKVAIGHARLVTNGLLEQTNNNQPVIKNHSVGVHNGIIVNDQELWQKHPQLNQESEVDTEVLFALITMYKAQGMSLQEAVAQTFAQVRGTASIAMMFDDTAQVLLATNHGSLYIAHNDQGAYVFASERYILEQIVDTTTYTIEHLKANTARVIQTSSTADHTTDKRAIVTHQSTQTTDAHAPQSLVHMQHNVQQPSTHQGTTPSLQRCKRCILPHTMPFIRFDDQGVCWYCRHHKKLTAKKTPQDLQTILQQYRSTDGSPDCIIGLSGGRDSSYGLHLLKKELGMHPIAYSYDWGMITDIGRRNQARMCGDLGVEHIFISADIRRKRAYIRKNVLAWLKRPDLGTVPLFMAGDKQYFYHANKLKKHMNINLTILCACPLERTDFKTGFCGIAPKTDSKKMYYNLQALDSIRLAFYYAQQYMLNPAYINASLFDTIGAFGSYYVIAQDNVALFEYLPWDEQHINAVLTQTYDWQRAHDTDTTWRIADGTAAFYNYIYYTAAGFTEHDTFRSNQIREGMITRDQALAYVERENQPRWDSIKWYCDTIGIDFEHTIRGINAMKKRYA